MGRRARGNGGVFPGSGLPVLVDFLPAQWQDDAKVAKSFVA
jgi:hypothetical protein